MLRKFYLDTSVWLDFFENRNEPNMPKGKWAKELLEKIVQADVKIVYSDLTLYELASVGYSNYEIDELLEPLRQILIFVEATEKEARQAKDIALKNNIPKADVLHALIARDNKSVLVTLDRHFQKISHITKPVKPQNAILP